jgi:hypothetical protein
MRCGAESCSCFVTGLTFRCYKLELVKNSLVIEGDEWIRETARAAAVPDILHGLRTLAVSPRASHLSAPSVRPAPVVDGEIRHLLRPRADRTACGACENVRARGVMPLAVR